MWFVVVALAFMFVGRKIGWTLSKTLFYPAPFVLALIATIIWGILVAAGVSGLISWLRPGTALKWVFGFALGAYVAVPNFGLYTESTIPSSAVPRHVMISYLPLVAFAVTEIAAACVGL